MVIQCIPTSDEDTLLKPQNKTTAQNFDIAVYSKHKI